MVPGRQRAQRDPTEPRSQHLTWSSSSIIVTVSETLSTIPAPADQLGIDLRPHQRGDGPVIVTRDESERRHRQSRLGALGLLVVLNVADLITTRAFLAAGAIEANPLGAFLIDRGWVGWVKGLLLLGLGIKVLRSPARVGTTSMLWFVVGVYATVVTVNLMALRALGVL